MNRSCTFPFILLVHLRVYTISFKRQEFEAIIQHFTEYLYGRISALLNTEYHSFTSAVSEKITHAGVWDAS